MIEISCLKEFNFEYFEFSNSKCLIVRFDCFNDWIQRTFDKITFWKFPKAFGETLFFEICDTHFNLWKILVASRIIEIYLHGDQILK